MNRLLRVLPALGLCLMAACGAKPPTDLMANARGRLDLAVEAERCAEAEYRAAQALLVQAQQAYDAKDYKTAASLAAAATAQADHAREVAEANRAQCNRREEITQQVEQTHQERVAPPPTAAVTGPHEWKTIYFGFDSNTVEGESARILDGHAAWLKANPAARIRVEGHCDEAGSTEYNLALGERRARAVKEYLVQLGVGAERIAVLSYGEEMPASDSDAQNRRAEIRAPLTGMQPCSLPTGTRVASFDVGSNTVIMLVAEWTGAGWEVVTDEAEITRVSEGLDQHGLLFQNGLERTAEALARFARTADALGVNHRIATGTAPFRRAGNGGDAARELSLAIGAPLEVVTGEHEAMLSLWATRGSFPELAEAQILDIGGASTEVIELRADGSHAVMSIDVGSVRLTERCVTTDPIAASQYQAVQHEVQGALDRAGLAAATGGGPLVGIAGTVTTLAALSLELETYDADRVHGHRLSLAELERLERALFALTLRQRRCLPGMPAKRADVIPAGCALLSALARRLGASEVLVSDRGIRWGRLFEVYGR